MYGYIYKSGKDPEWYGEGRDKRKGKKKRRDKVKILTEHMSCGPF
jgi:hypothetical protein